jgi:hypothetical protein
MLFFDNSVPRVDKLSPSPIPDWWAESVSTGLRSTTFLEVVISDVAYFHQICCEHMCDMLRKYMQDVVMFT